MKKKIAFLYVVILLFSISCSVNRGAKQMYENLPDAGDCIKNPELAKQTISKLDEIIKMAPNWWDPYRMKIALYSSVELNDSDSDPDKQIIKVYESWAEKNNMDIQILVAYATHLDKIGEDEKALDAMRQAWNDFNKKKKKRPKDSNEENMMFAGVFAGVWLGEVSSENIGDYHFVAERNPDLINALESMVKSNSDALFLWD